MNDSDVCRVLFGLDLPPARLEELLTAYRTIATEIARLRELDLTDTHPAIIFEPTAPYRLKDDA